MLTNNQFESQYDKHLYESTLAAKRCTELSEGTNVGPDIRKHSSVKSEEFNNSEKKRFVLTVNSTWKSIKLDQKTIEYIAEDKEIEYEF